MAKLILLDRDGVINFDSPDSIRCADEWTPIPGSLQAIAELQKSERLIGICSNQSGVGRGLFSAADLAEIEARLVTELAEFDASIDCFCYCPHHPDQGCDCRKPKPGLLERAMRELGVAPADTCFVGDSKRDLDAAVQAGCRPILVLTGNGRDTLAYAADYEGLQIFDNLAAFAANEISTGAAACPI